MVCPFCLHKKTNVYNSRHGTKLNVTWRRRRCPTCGREFTTYEAADAGSILQLKDGRSIKPFSSAHLMMSILKACDHRSDTDESVPYLARTIEQALYRSCADDDNHWLTKDQIVSTVSVVLQRFDAAAYVKYVSRYQQRLDAPAIRRALRRTK